MIKIESEKRVKQGERYRFIINISGVIPNDKLPKEYIDGRLRLLKDVDGFVIKDGIYNIGYLYPNREVTEEDFQRIVKYARKAGYLLHEARKREKKLKEEWKGNETVII